MIRRLRRTVTLTVVVAALLVTSVAADVDGWLLPVGDDEVVTLLLLGSDDGPPRSGQTERANADGFQLLFVSADRQHATFVSIPRDSYVSVPGQGRTRINACLFNGPERCVDTVESEFGISVDGYLLTNMRAFARGVQRFGGIDIDVPTSLQVGGVRVSSGEQRLNGPEALVYARDRTVRSGGDLARSAAQAELLAAAHRRVVESGSPSRVFRALTELRRHTITDLSGTDLTRYAFEALQLPPGNVRREVADGGVGFAGAASVVFLRDSAYELIRDAADDGRVE